MNLMNIRGMFRSGCFAAMAIAVSLACAGCGTTSNSSSSPQSATSGNVVDASGKRAVVKEEAIKTFEDATKLIKSNPDAAIEGFKKAAGEEKNFAEADRIRAGLLEKGVALEDTREGVKWHLV